ncbi:MAG: glyoxalase/bleomycin resistance/extradiol dioxygenase family protein [Defluviitaleaceae bacterium]|nr:glyoxalase/bleomycin resistance/extradiol dioxygenase family protein [Defluviitaleaceae bacterium]
MIAPFFHIHGGKCAEAIETYKKAFAAEVHHISYYRESPEFNPETENGDLIMHASVTLLNSRTDMCDDDGSNPISGNNLALSAYYNTPEDLRRGFEALKEGATIEEEPGLQFWSTLYARLIDKYGIMWHLMVKENL